MESPIFPDFIFLKQLLLKSTQEILSVCLAIVLFFRVLTFKRAQETHRGVWPYNNIKENLICQEIIEISTIHLIAQLLRQQNS